MSDERVRETIDLEDRECEAELRAAHRPEMHGAEPCPSGGCCECQVEGVCETGTALALLAKARASAEQAERERDAALLALAECRASLVRIRDAGTSGGGWADWECLICRASWFGAASAAPNITHESDCILAATEPERALAALAAEVAEVLAHSRDALDSLERRDELAALDTLRALVRERTA